MSELNGKTIGDHKVQLLDIHEVHTQHLSNYLYSFPPQVLGPDDLLRSKGHTKGSSIYFLFDSRSSHNSINDCLVQMLGLQPSLSDHT